MEKQFKEWWENASKTLKCDQYDAYEIWQQAQKVAVPESSVNLKKFDLLRKMHNIRDLNNGEYYSDEIEENICGVEAMIEAQEQAND